MENPDQFSKKKIAIIIGIVIVVLAAAGALYWPTFKEERETSALRKQRLEDLKQKNPERAEKLLAGIADSQNKLKSNPQDVDSWMNLGVWSQTIGDYRTAEKAYKKLIEINALNITAWNNLGELYILEGKYEEGRDALLNYLEISPEEVGVYLRLAELYAAGHAGTVEDAKFILQQGVLKTNNEGLKEALEKLNKEGKL